MNFIQQILTNFPPIVEVWGSDLKPTSGAEMVRSVGQVRNFLKAFGIQSKDRIALLGPNSARWVSCDVGIISSGAISVPLYSRLTPEELARMLADCQPKLLIVSDPDLRDAVLKVWENPSDSVLLEEVFSASEDAPPPVAVNESDIVTIVYTSGTSGEPKGVMLSRGNFDFMLERTSSALLETTHRDPGFDRVFHFLPCNFLAARLGLWTQLYRGNAIYLSTDLKNLVAEIGTAQPNYFLTVPALLERIRNGVSEKIKEKGGIGENLYRRGTTAYQHSGNGGTSFSDRLALSLARRIVFDKIRTKIGPNLEFIICGSAPLSAETQQWFEMLGIPILQVYGLTETTGILTMDRFGSTRSGYVGTVIDGVETKVTEDGELLSRGPNNFQGYWQKPEESREVLRDGWIQTGDQVEFDSQGRLRIVGRLKNLIVPLSAHKVAPEPLEQQLVEECPGAEHAFVVGHGKPYLSVLITGNASEADIQKAIDRLNDAQPHYKKIKKFKRVDEKFTVENGLLTANQKVRRSLIEDHFQKEIETLYA